MDILIQPFGYAFFQKAVVAILLVGLSCAWVGSFIVLRRMTFLTGALSHTILPGIVVAYLTGIPLFVGAMGAGLLTAFGIHFLHSSSKIREDNVIGILLSGMLALGVLLMGFSGSFRDFGTLLFGNVLSVQSMDIIFSGGVLITLFLSLYFFHKELELASYDKDYAETIGVHPKKLHLLLLLLTTLCVVAGIKLLGALLTTAMIVLPGTTAFLLTHNLRKGILLAMGIACISGVTGLYLSFYFDVLSGPAIVLVACSLFLFTWIYKKIFNMRGNFYSVKGSSPR